MEGIIIPAMNLDRFKFWDLERPDGQKAPPKYHDKLGREDYAAQVAQYIIGDYLIPEDDRGQSDVSTTGDWRRRRGDTASRTVAIYGEWGSGKTFLKNMVRRKIWEHDRTIPVIEFNPWEWSGQEKLTEGFFQTLQDKFQQLGSASWFQGARRNRKIARRIRLASRILGVPTASPREVSALTTLAVGLFGFFVGAGALQLDGLLRWSLIVVSAIVLLGWIGSKILENLASVFDQLASLKERSLEDVKTKLRELLEGYDRPILIILDDIDRLRAAQIRMVMQLVKANADFPNVTYLLLCEQAVVEKSLGDPESGIKGSDYSEKIVQRGFNLPTISEGRLLKILDERLKKVVSDLPVDMQDEVDFGRIDRMKESYFPTFLRTLRNVDRFLDSLHFHLRLYIDDKSQRLDINVPDLVALEILRVCEPEVFRALPPHKSNLAPRAVTTIQSDPLRNQTQLTVERLLEPVDKGEQESGRIRQESRKKAIRGILKDVFPVVAWEESGSERFNPKPETWEAERRACHPDMFGRYFQRTLPEDALRKAEVDEIINIASDLPLLTNVLKGLIEKGKKDKKIRPALVSLHARIDEVDEQDYSNIIQALLDIGDAIPYRIEYYASKGAPRKAKEIIEVLLESGTESPEERGKMLGDAIESSDSLKFCVEFVDEVDERNRQQINRDPEHPLYSYHQVIRAKQACIAKIAKESPNKLVYNDGLEFLLIKWYKWGGASAPKSWLRSQVSEIETLFHVLKGFRIPPPASFRQTVFNQDDLRVDHVIDIVALSKFGVLEELGEQVRRIDEDILNDDQKELLTLFEISMKYKGALESPSRYFNVDTTTVHEPEPAIDEVDILNSYTEAFDLPEHESTESSGEKEREKEDGGKGDSKSDS